MSAGSTPAQQPASLFGINTILIGFGSMLFVVMLLLLTLFDSAAGQRLPLESVVQGAEGRAINPNTTVANDIIVVSAPVAQVAINNDTLRAAVERANQAFIQARAQANIAPLESVAVGAWLSQEQSYLAGMRARGQTERWRLVRLEYVRVEPRSTSTGFVCTRETWEVTTLGPGSATSATRTYIFQEGYDLVQSGNNLMVTSIEVGPG